MGDRLTLSDPNEGHVAATATSAAIPEKKSFWRTMGEAIASDPMTALKCTTASFVAATIPALIDAPSDATRVLVGQSQQSGYATATSNYLKKVMGADDNKLDTTNKALACAAGDVFGTIGGATLTTAAVAYATGGTLAPATAARGAASMSMAFNNLNKVQQISQLAMRPTVGLIVGASVLTTSDGLVKGGQAIYNAVAPAPVGR